MRSAAATKGLQDAGRDAYDSYSPAGPMDGTAHLTLSSYGDWPSSERIP